MKSCHVTDADIRTLALQLDAVLRHHGRPRTPHFDALYRRVVEHKKLSVAQWRQLKQPPISNAGDTQ